MTIARGRIRKGEMNKTESRYAQELELRKRVGEILWCEFEGITLKLGFDCRYTPDFAVMLANGELEMHEVKGFMKEDAQVKIRTAAKNFPFRFYLARWKDGGFEVKEVK
jgi:hypothetical protein